MRSSANSPACTTSPATAAPRCRAAATAAARCRAARSAWALRRHLVLGHLAGRRRHRDRGPVLGDEIVKADAEVVGDPDLELLDAQPLLGTKYLVAVDRIGELGQLPGELANPYPHVAELLFPLRALHHHRVSLGHGPVQ